MKKITRLLKHLFLPHRGNAFRPHALRHKAISLYSLGMITSQLAFGVTAFTGPIVSVEQSRAISVNVVKLTNNERTQNGLAELKENTSLTQAAFAKIDDMFEKGYWDHRGPGGETAWDFITEEGYVYQLAGENLARGFSSSQDAVNAWMESETHRQNILNSRFKEIGVATKSGTLGNNATTLIVQLFGEPKTAFASANEIRGQYSKTSQLIPQINLDNPVHVSRAPYFMLWIFLFGLIIVDGFMIRKLGLHASKKHIFELRSTLLLAVFGLFILLVGFTGIA